MTPGRPGRRPAGGAASAGDGRRVRLQKILASAGLASRREAEEWLRQGRVAVNGRTAQLGESADPARDRIELDGERVAGQRLDYWVAHKPAGVVTTRRDPQGRSTILELLPPSARQLFPVGRLDRDTEGLVLLTNDGDLAHTLLHPSLGNEREYRVTVEGPLPDRVRRRLAKGVHLRDGPTGPARVRSLRFDAKTHSTSFQLVLTQGRKRQIRRTLVALGHPVVRLVRVRFGPLALGDLASGRARRLRPEEVAALRGHAAALTAR